MSGVPPMPKRTTVHGTIRDIGYEIPVARVSLEDVTGDQREFDLDEIVAFDLAMQLLTFCRQVR